MSIDKTKVTIKEMIQEPDLDYYHNEYWNKDTCGPFLFKFVDDLQTKGRRPFYFITDEVENMICTVKSRTWKSARGNIHLTIGIPKEKMKDKIYECAPLIVPLATIDYLNTLTDDPECYRLKFSNDVLCDHVKKNGGILCRDYKDYCVAFVYLNLHYSPPKEGLRKEGILACSIDQHCTKKDLSDYEKLGKELAHKIYADVTSFNHPNEVCDKFNKYLYVMDKQKRTVYRYNESEGNYTVVRDGKEILVEYGDGSFYDPYESKSIVHKYDYFEPELCNGDAA